MSASEQPAAAGRDASTPTEASPIADLTYRTYDGPLHTRAVRWWIITVASLRLALKQKGFWLVVALAALPYLFSVLQLYLSSLATQGAPNPFMDTTPGQRFARQFFQAFTNQQLFLFVLTLMVGSGSIARDHQTNALLVYLSKPLTKGDYVAGKWMGIFLIIFCVGAAPALLLYAYCLFSYWNEGILRQEPWLLLRALLACAVPAAVHASAMIGFSAWSRTARMAGAFYAGLYFVSQAVVMMIWGFRYRGDMMEGILLRHVSIPGAIEGLAQNVYGITLRMPFGSRARGGLEMLELAAPNVWVVLAIVMGIVVSGLVAARVRIRAVEVVRG